MVLNVSQSQVRNPYCESTYLIFKLVDESHIRFEQILPFLKDYDQIFNNFHTNPSINSVEILEFLVVTCDFSISTLLWVGLGRHK